MTIASADKEISGLVENFDVYGAEAVINALVRACRGKRFLNKKALLDIFDHSFEVWGNKEGVKCTKCGDVFSSEEIEDFRFEHEPFGKDPFMCPDCYDRFMRQDLEDQFKELMDENAATV